MRNRRGDLYKTYSMENEILEYVISILNDENRHQSSCGFPGEECTCKGFDEIDCDTPLLREGYIDSFMVETIVVFLEEHYNVEIPSKHINPDNFGSVNNMAKLVKKL